MEEIFKRVPLFSMLGEEDLKQLLQIAEKHSYNKNVVLFHKGDPGDALLVLLSGKLRIFLANENGREITLSFLKPYEYLGEVSILDDARRSASVQAVEKSSVYVIQKRRFREFLTKHPEMALVLLQQMSRLIRRLTDEIDGLSFHDVYGRVARKIWSLVETEGVEKEGFVEVQHELTHQDLAGMIGCARESVTKVLNSMETEGILVMDRRIILIKQPKKLQVFYEGSGARLCSSTL